MTEHDLVLVGVERLAVKGEDGPVATSGWPSRGGGELELGAQTWRDASLDYLGIGTGDPFGVGSMLRFDGRVGLTDRLAWKIGTVALAYQLGEPGGVEVVPYGGLLS